MRVVGDNVGQPQVLPIRDALKLADELELDLIEISPKAEPTRQAEISYAVFCLKKNRQHVPTA